MTPMLAGLLLAFAALLLATALRILAGDRQPRHRLTRAARRAARARQRERERNGGHLEGYAEQLAEMNADLAAERDRAEAEGEAAQRFESWSQPGYLFGQHHGLEGHRG